MHKEYKFNCTELMDGVLVETGFIPSSYVVLVTDCILIINNKSVIMKNNEEKTIVKGEYIPPVLEVEEIEMGIASGSSTVTPAVSGGIVDSVGTTWSSDDSQAISSGAFN